MRDELHAGLEWNSLRFELVGRPSPCHTITEPWKLTKSHDGKCRFKPMRRLCDILQHFLPREH